MKTQKRAQECLSGIGSGKIFGHIAVAFDDVDHFEPLAFVTEEDDVAFKRCASKIGSEFRAIAAHFERKRSEMVAIGADAEDEFAGNTDNAAGPVEVGPEFGKVALRRSSEERPTHSGNP